MSRQIAVIGLGLIGGSIAMGLKEFEDFKRVGVDVSQPTLRYALEQGIVDQVCEDPVSYTHLSPDWMTWR